MDLLVIATPDDTVPRVAAAVAPVATTAVVHLSGSLGLDVLGAHPRRGSLHPLVPLPNPSVGAERLTSGITFAVAGDAIARQVAEALGGRTVEVEDRNRAAYHAAASIAANHLVALVGQVERVAATVGLPLEAFAGLLHAATDDALELGPRRALTGPAARGDWDTVERHRAVLAGMAGHRNELAAYDALVGLARRLSLDPAGAGTGGPGPGRPGAGGVTTDVAEAPSAATLPPPRISPGTRRVRTPAARPRVIETIAEYSEALDAVRRSGRTVGVVPTMGALHEGHRALITRAMSECDVAAVSIFVNPTQFGDPSDLAGYPRPFETDLDTVASAGSQLVFAPSVSEMYPDPPGTAATSVSAPALGARWEGASRPGHFDGVATVVVKLLSAAGRSRAYFGEKDFQQLAVVTRVVRDLALPTRVVGCPTVREPDGLALSSRNARLDPDQRRSALVLSRALRVGTARLADGAAPSGGGGGDEAGRLV